MRTKPLSKCVTHEHSVGTSSFCSLPELLQEAAQWRLLSLLLECPRPGWAREAMALARELRATGVADAHDWLAAASSCEGASAGDYLAILGPGGLLSPREVRYRPMHDPGQLLAELRALYEAFGYTFELKEPPDHVAIELGFMGFLRLKAAYALANEELESVEITRVTADRFANDHLSLFAGELAQQLADISIHPLRPCGTLLRKLLPRPKASRSLRLVAAQQANGSHD